jgi:uncharacterized protein
MSIENAAKVVAWIGTRLDEVRPAKFVLTLFGGEPLLNLPVAYYLAEQCHALCQARGIPQGISVITNGLLLTPEVVTRLKPYGLHGVKVTLDGDRDTHNRMRPLRGRQGTFDRRCSTSCASRSSRTRSPRSTSSRSSSRSRRRRQRV